MSNVKINRIECDSCNATVDIPEEVIIPGMDSPNAGWTHVNVRTNASEEHPSVGKYFDLCEACTELFENQLETFLEQWGK